MKVLVRGLGSIGLRHVHIAQKLGHEVVGMSSAPCFLCPVYTSLEEVFATTGRVDLAIIATATAHHLRDMKALQPYFARIGRLLVEKPVVDRCEALEHLPETSSPIFVAYNLRQHPCILRLRALLAGQHLESLHLYVGQYLPSWRPDIDYRTSYSASAYLGGGVLRDLSHELDLACLLAGPWRELTAFGGHISHLEIASDDVYTILARHESCPHVVCHMNYLDRKATRHIVANTSGGTYTVDLIASTVASPAGIEHFPVSQDTTYTLQLRVALEDTKPKLCSLHEAQEVVRMINAIEQASQQGVWVRA